MRKKFKWKLIAFFATIASLLLLGGCTFNPTLEERMEEAGTEVLVTYYSNGTGSGFNKNTSKTEVTLYLPENAIAFNLLTDTIEGNASKVDPYTPTRENYTFVGWYEAQLDENGEPLTNEKGEVVLSDEPYFAVDGSNRETLPAGTHLKLYAKWQADVAVKVYLLIGDEVETTTEYQISRDDTTVTIEQGGWLTDINFFNGECHRPSDKTLNKNAAFNASGYTLFDLYLDEDCQTRWSETIVQGDSDVIVYAKFLAGNWTYLKNPNDVKNLFTAGAKTDFYLVNDIDCKDVTGITCVPNFNSLLRGNGYTISNLTINAGEIMSESTASMFGNIGKTGGLQNVTFDGVTIKTTLLSGRQAYAYALFESIWDTASVQGVKIKTVDFILERTSTDATFLNMYANDEWHFNHVLFGGIVTNQEEVDNGTAQTTVVNKNLTDAEFVDENGEICLGVDISETRVQLTVKLNGVEQFKLPTA